MGSLQAVRLMQSHGCLYSCRVFKRDLGKLAWIPMNIYNYTAPKLNPITALQYAGFVHQKKMRGKQERWSCGAAFGETSLLVAELKCFISDRSNLFFGHFA